MKVVLLLCLLGIVHAEPATSFWDTISNYYDNNIGQGAYRFGFDQPDGTKQEQEGEFITKDGEELLSVKGIFSYIGNDGVKYTTKYKADDNGFQPVIEQGPGGSVPDAVVASLLG